MTTKVYLTIAAIIAILYGLAFALIPAQMGSIYGAILEPNAVLNLRFFGSALLAWGVITWFARDFHEWSALRGVLIGTAVGDIVGGLVNIWGTIQGLMNSFAWSSTILYALLLIGALFCLVTGQRKAV